jgi:hypothetical protein
MSRERIRSMSLDDFLRYLLGRDHTRDLALQLAYVRDDRQTRAERVGVGR